MPDCHCLVTAGWQVAQVSMSPRVLPSTMPSPWIAASDGANLPGTRGSEAIGVAGGVTAGLWSAPPLLPEPLLAGQAASATRSTAQTRIADIMPEAGAGGVLRRPRQTAAARA